MDNNTGQKGSEALGEGTPKEACAVPPPIGSPLVVDWEQGELSSLDQSLREGKPVLVKYDCKSVKLLPRCEAKVGKYSYLALAPVEKKIELKSELEVGANLPFGVVKLSANVSATSQLNVGMFIVGSRTTPFKRLGTSDLSGDDCAQATHFVRSAQIGAFWVEKASKTAADVKVDVMGYNASAAGGQEKVSGFSAGKVEACKESKSDASAAPSECGAPVRLELFALSKDDGGIKEGTTETGTPLINPCPPGLTFVNNKCTAAEGTRGTQCQPGNFDDCERQCKMGHAGSCVSLGRIYAYGIGRPRDVKMAEEPFTTACDQDHPKGCLNMAWLFSKGLEAKKKDPQKAKIAARKAGYLLKDACDANDAEACGLAGTLNGRNGYGVPDLVIAKEFLERACQGGYAESCYELADGEYSNKQETRIANLKRSCAGGYARGCNMAGLTLDRIQIDAIKKRNEQKKAAPAKNNRAMEDQPDSKGEGDEGDEKEDNKNAVPSREEVIDLYRQSCEGGFPMGCRNYAVYMARENDATEEDLNVAKGAWGQFFTLLENDCKKNGNADACADLGEAQDPSDGIRRIIGKLKISPDTKAAQQSYDEWEKTKRDECNRNITESCFELHKAYANGTHRRPQDKYVSDEYYDRARHQWEPLCAPDNTRPCIVLAKNMILGFGSQSTLSLRQWLHTACVNNNYEACVLMGAQYAGKATFLDYNHKQVFGKDPIEAQTWLGKACEGNYNYRNIKSCELLATFLEEPSSIRDERKALALYEHTCAESNYQACWRYETRLKAAAQKKDKEAQSQLFDYYKKSCESSKMRNIAACSAYENSLRDGVGVAKDQLGYFRAISDRCVRTFSPDACALSGSLLYTGTTGLKEDKKAAEDRFNIACPAGQYSYQRSDGCTALGQLFEQAKAPMRKDVKRAAEFYARGCSKSPRRTSYAESCMALAKLQNSTALGKFDRIEALKTLDYSCKYAAGNWRATCEERNKLAKTIPVNQLPPGISIPNVKPATPGPGMTGPKPPPGTTPKPAGPQPKK